MKKIYLIVILIFTLSQSQAQVVINEIYGGGGNAGSNYRQDFIELYNNGTTPVDLSTWSVQYASATGSTWQKTNLSGTIAPHSYYLIQEATGAGGSTNIPTPDATGTIPMSGTTGKIFLVNNQTLLTGTCPSGASVIDYVGFGTANCFEGTVAPAPSNSNSIQRIFSASTAQDTQNNNADFTAGLPSPTNGTGAADITPPAVSTLSPANGATNVATSVTASITFNEAVVKGTSGTITIKRNADDVIVQSYDITTSSVTITGSSASFDINAISLSTQYYIEVSAGSFKDLSGNDFSGITGNTIWSFTTAAGAPTGTLGTTYSFDICSSGLPDGFSQYSVAGAQVWACTTFGRDAANLPLGSAPNGVQINGFASGTNVLNQDWFISPAYDLTSTTFPLLSFWSRTAFNGLPLKLRVSTNYVSGDPSLATWTDLNGNFPGQASDFWKLSSNINLSSFKTTGVRFAFVYTSSVDDGARWTLDDITIINSAIAPPPSLTVSTGNIQFGYVAAASSNVKQFTFTGSELTGGVTLTSTGSFQVSKDNVSFNSVISYTQTEANNLTSIVYVKFAPLTAGLDYTGTITINTSGVTDTIISLNGTSIDPVNTLEVVNWNIEWFGSTTLGPVNDAQQEANVRTILQNIGADIYALAEVVSEPRLANIVSQMPGYAYVLSNYGSHTNTSANPPSALAEAQKLGFVYKSSLLSNVTVAPLLSQGINSAADLTNPAYNYFASGRFPFMMTADVTLNGVTKNIHFILIHGKANTSPTATSYARRKAAADTLHFTLNNLYPVDNIILLGDYNDDLDQSITAGFTTTSYSAFTTDNTNFYSPTLPLSLAGKKSTISYNDVIDHVMLSNELQCSYMPATANILTDVTSLVINYGSTTTDHYPVFTRYAFASAPIASITYQGSPYCQSTGNAAVTLSGTNGGSYSSTPGLIIGPATGELNIGTSISGTYTVTYTVAASGCTPAVIATTIITITAAPSATINYTGNPYCQNAGTATVTLTGTAGGAFTSSAGLSINPVSGQINLATSTAGTYIVTYTIAASGGCAAYSVNTTVIINAAPSASIGYGSASFCQGTGMALITQTGTVGGVYTSTTGLNLNSNTGAVTLGSSTPGLYIVTYTIAASGGCSNYTTTANITITPNPSATISYTASTFCTTNATAPVTITGTSGGTFTSTTGLNIDPSSGLINTASSTPGIYLITYTIPAAGGCAAVTATASLSISTPSVAATSATATSTALCGGGLINLSVQGGVLGTGATWKWYTSCGTGTIVGTGSTLNNILVTTPTTFYVRAEGSCNNTACASITVDVTPIPSISISAAPYLNLQPGLTTTLTATVTPATNSITWFRNGAIINGANSNSLEVNADGIGSYYAKVSMPAGCYANSNTINISDSLSDKLFITPNPNRGQFQIRYTSVNGISALRYVTIFDGKGARVYSHAFSVINPYNSMNVDLRTTGKGLYFVIVADANGKKLAEGRVNIL